MDIGEKFTALENLIYQYACTQFELNNIPPTQALVVMKCVNSRFQEIALNTDLMNRISIQQAETLNKDEKHTGTAEDLIKAFNETGFHPDGGSPEPGEEDKYDNS